MSIGHHLGPAHRRWGRALLAAVVAAVAAIGSQPAAAAFTQVLQNPGFESGPEVNPAPWVPSSNLPGRTLVSSVAPLGGTRSADLCNRNNCHESFEQRLTAPPGFTEGEMRFFVRFDTTQPANELNLCQDNLMVLVWTSSRDVLFTNQVCAGSNPNGSYREFGGRLFGSFTDRDLLVQVVATTNGRDLSRIWVDDISLTLKVPVVPSAPTNVTATANGGGDATVTWGAPLTGNEPASWTVTPAGGSGGTGQTLGPDARTASFTGLTGSDVTFSVMATNGAGPGPPATSNAMDASAATPVVDRVSDRQYQLNSDGFTWVDVDPLNLATTYTPPTPGQLLLDANIDLWTAAAGVNQDVAVVVGGGTFGAGAVVAWKESGGFAGTFSPNAAAINTAVDVQAGTPYTIRLAWKANQAAPTRTIFAGAGPMSPFSPTRLTARFVPAAEPISVTRRTEQFLLTGSDGATWRPMDGTTAGDPVAPFTNAFTATADGVAAITGNVDLWTWDAGYNQDIGIRLSGGAYGAGQIVAWKESGGFAGRFNPNAALVEARMPVAGGVAYTAELVWKANKPMPTGVRISAGAGSPVVGAPAAFSPTTLTVAQEATAAIASKVAATQYRLDGGDGVTWRDLDTPQHDQEPFGVTYVPPADGYVQILGNTDLWTYIAGYNQDIGIRVTPPDADPGTAPAGIVAWKESGGFAGTLSPNAAAVEGYYPVRGGLAYRFTLVWKINKWASAGYSISAGAGSPGDFSPTRLDLTFRPR